MLAPALARGLAARPPLPYRNTNGGPLVLSYQGVALDLGSTTDTSTTPSPVDIGAAHPDRVVILAIYSNPTSTGTLVARVNGYEAYISERVLSFFITCHKVPTTDTKAIISVTLTGSTRKAVGVYAAYPANLLPIDRNNAQDGSNTTSPTVTPTVSCIAGGCSVTCGGAGTNGVTFTLSNSGTDNTTTDRNASLAGAITYCWGSLLNSYRANLTHTMAKNGTSCSGRYQVMTFGPPSSYVGI